MANIYYVRPDGSNTNTGLGYTTALAYATISKVASVMVAGDTVRIAPGTYRETVTVTNSGSIGLPITYQGDRKCEYFLDMQMGDVIISGINTEADTSIARNVGFGAANYLNIINIDFENINSGGNGVISGGTGTYVKNCNMTKGIFAIGVLASANTVIENCKIFTTSKAINTGAGGTPVTIRNCILKSTGQSDVIYITGAFTVTCEHCIIEGAYNPGTASAVLNLYGCVWSCGSNPNVAGVVINLDVSTKLINSKGSTFIGRGSLIASSSPSTWYGTKFKDVNKLQLQVANTTSFCEFENASNAGVQSSASQTLSSCYFKNCVIALSSLTGTLTSSSSRFYANPNTTNGTVTNTTPTYGETDVVAGIVASPTNPISGTKSLKVAGYDYGTVFTQWIPCESGKPKKVKVKVKRNSATFGTTIRLGDQCVGMSNNMKYVGTGWTNNADASYSGGAYLRTNVTDDYIEYTFTGTGIRLLTSKFSSYGICGISVDGGSETNVDLYNASQLYQQNVFEVTGLSNGTHKIKVRNTGTKNASAGGNYIPADAFQVYNGSWGANVEAETVSTSVETIEVTYTHHKTELVPLFINTRVNSGGGDFIQYDDIQ